MTLYSKIILGQIIITSTVGLLGIGTMINQYTSRKDVIEATRDGCIDGAYRALKLVHEEFYDPNHELIDSILEIVTKNCQVEYRKALIK
jgi:hypothetical protein